MRTLRRIGRSIIVMVVVIVALPAANLLAADLTIERLTWAGIKMVSDETTVFVDAVGTDLWDGNAPEGLVPVIADTRRRYALITHTHNDHFDVETLKEVLGDKGYVICHESIATHVASRGLKVIPARLYEPILRGGFVFMAVPAMDGLGSEQVSWIIRNGDQQFLHAGYTLWHGLWSAIGQAYGPFDTVFLPINGARVMQDPMPETPVSLTPTQAIDAALMLRADLLVPIHYGLNDPPYYTEVEDALEKVIAEGERREQKVQHLEPGQKL